jgi:uncharacterized membrane protein YdjX (TVP38/TMEM64 family)
MEKKKILLYSISSTLIAGLVFLIIKFNVSQYIQPEIIKEFIVGFGSFAIITYIILYAIAMFIPYLGPVMSVTGGLVFGTLLGTIITVIVATLTSTLPFLLSRKLGKKWVEKKLEGTKFENYADKAKKNDFLFVLYMRLIPVLPYELQNYVAGLTNISIPKFMLATFLGILPGTFALTFLGESITDIGSTQFWIAILIFTIAFIVPISINTLVTKHKKKQSKKEKSTL